MRFKLLLAVAETLAFIGSLFADDFPVTEQLQPAFVVTQQHSVTSQAEPERNERVLFFTASWCNPCRYAKSEFIPWMTPSGWVVSESPSAHVQVIDADANPDLLRQYNVHSLPTFVMIRNRKELRRVVGYKDKATVVNLWFDKSQPQQQASSVSTSTSANEAAPTPYSKIVLALTLLPKPDIAFVEFGCGASAPWCVAAVQRWGCKAIGIEIDPARARAAQEHVHALGLDHLITIIEGDATQVDIDADVGAAYLYSDVLEALRPRTERLRAFASYKHRPPGLPVIQNGDIWIYTRQVSQSRQPYAVWGGQAYTHPVCGDPKCDMCYGPNGIATQLSRGGR